MDAIYSIFANVKPTNTIEFIVFVIGIAYVGSKVADVISKKNANLEFATKQDLKATKEEVSNLVENKAEKEDVNLIRSEVKTNRHDINRVMETISEHKVEMKGLSKDVERIITLISISNSNIKEIGDKIDSLIMQKSEGKNGK